MPPCRAIQRASRSVGRKRGNEQREHGVPGEHVPGRDQPARGADRGTAAGVGLAPADDRAEPADRERRATMPAVAKLTPGWFVSPSQETRAGMFQIARRVTTPPFAFVIECSAPGRRSISGPETTTEGPSSASRPRLP